MGWLLVLLGIALAGIGTFLVYYGQDLVRHGQSETSVQRLQEAKRVLSPIQERLLRLLADYQQRFAVHKLIIARAGKLYFDPDSPHSETKVSLLTDLFGVKEDDESRARELEMLIEQMPDEYLRRLPESRFDNPFVVAVSEEGINYLRGK